MMWVGARVHALLDLPPPPHLPGTCSWFPSALSQTGTLCPGCLEGLIHLLFSAHRILGRQLCEDFLHTSNPGIKLIPVQNSYSSGCHHGLSDKFMGRGDWPAPPSLLETLRLHFAPAIQIMQLALTIIFWHFGIFGLRSSHTSSNSLDQNSGALSPCTVLLSNATGLFIQSR